MPTNAVCSAAPPCEDALILVDEINHRVYNQYAQVIAAMRIAARAAPSVEAQAALACAVDRLISHAEAHRALEAPRHVGYLDLSTYLEGLCAVISTASLEERQIRLTLSVDPVLLPAWSCWRVALIVAELITNSVRHGLCGRPGEIRLKIERQAALVTCEVVDSGIARSMVKPGRGTAIVAGLARELGGEVTWRFGPEGTATRLVFPIAGVDATA